MGNLSIVLLFISVVALSSCNQALRGLSAHGDLNTLPQTLEELELEPGREIPSTQQPPTSNRPNENNKNETPGKTESTKPKTLVRTDKKADKIIYYAQKIMESEGKKIGTACNLYVHRVLEVAGFSGERYRANDFDLYAEKHFSYYKVESFEYDTKATEVTRLERYLKSFPERHPFIMQWSRSGRVGHIALVERIGDKFVIFQASLGRYTARKDLTTPTILLNGYGRRSLNVYTDFSAK